MTLRRHGGRRVIDGAGFLADEHQRNAARHDQLRREGLEVERHDAGGRRIGHPFAVGRIGVDVEIVAGTAGLFRQAHDMVAGRLVDPLLGRGRGLRRRRLENRDFSEDRLGHGENAHQGESGNGKRFHGGPFEPAGVFCLSQLIRSDDRCPALSIKIDHIRSVHCFSPA